MPLSDLRTAKSLFRCYDHCNSKNTISYGLWEGKQCCSGDLPDENYRVDESFCDKTCSGEKCGGDKNQYVYSVYTIAPNQTSTPTIPSKPKPGVLH